MPVLFLRRFIGAVAMVLMVGGAEAQCQPSWVPTFGGLPGVDGTVNALTVFNNGAGPALYVGGNFTHANGAQAAFVAKWSGSKWSPVPGAAGAVNAFATFNDGSGPELYAGGAGVAKWTGTTWASLGGGMNGTVYALATFDDGSGLALYAGGNFTSAGGGAARGIAKWNGTAWSPVGPGQPPGLAGPVGARVLALSVFDDGNGKALYVGGNFTTAGTVANYKYIAKWDGSVWSTLGTGMNDQVSSLTVFDDGSGSALYAGGKFTSASGVPASHIAKWNGSTWSALAGGTSGDVFALTDFNDGNGRALYAGGLFVSAGGVVTNNIAKWSSSSWSALASGTAGNSQPSVNALCAFNGGSGRALYAGGGFAAAGGVGANCIAKWSGTTWYTLGGGISSIVSALRVFDDGSGPALFAGGLFASAGGIPASAVSKWNGSAWTPLGSGLGGSQPWVFALAVFDDGTGPALYAGGRFTTAGGATTNSIAKWDGAVWSALGSGVGGTGSPEVNALTVFDDGTGAALYAAGNFTTAGGVTVNHVAKWDGTTWTSLGVGMNSNNWVRTLAVFDDGSGPALFAGGSLTTAGGVNVSNIAKWNGSVWSALGGVIAAVYFIPEVKTLAVFDDGSGPTLCAAGIIGSIGGLVVNNIAKWNGATWSALGSGITGQPPPSAVTQVQALTVFDDGSGPKLVAMGSFTDAGGTAAGSIAAWDGSAWSSLGHGLSWYSLTLGGALEVYDDSSGPALYVGGSFASALDSGDSYLAKWGCPFVNSGTTYCTTGTTSNGCVPTISGTGSASASTGSGFTVSINHLESHRLGVIFYGIHGQLAASWGAGGTTMLCVKAPTQRMDTYDSGGSPGLCNGLISEDWNLFIATHASALGQPFLGGETVWAQGWFRDPPSPKTTGLSNGLVFAIAP